MAKAKQNERWNVSFTATDSNSNDTIKDLTMNWENRDLDSIKANLNTFLGAIGVALEVVERK
jgi:tRNA threonylcarbamoyladenosine modification (KEOPS) complex  Pcc1 subunit